MSTTHVFCGNLTQDGEYGITSSGMPFARLRLAVNESYRDGRGEWKTHPAVFWEATAWGTRAELLQAADLKKGEAVILEGRITNSDWQDESGGRHYKTTITVASIGRDLFRPKREKTEAPSSWSQSPSASRTAAYYDQYAGGEEVPETPMPGQIPGLGPVDADAEIGL